jgi:GT2 family glycosyltransferase
VTSVCVVNNDFAMTIEQPQNWPTDVELRVINLASNEGLPAALGRAFDALPDCDAILILDDDTMISPEIFDDLRTTLRDGTGIAAATTPFCDQMSPYDRPLLFPWSPSLVRREALENAGNPDRGLFFGYDDYDFALRLHRAGWRVGTTTVPIPDRRLDTPWPERRYFGVRNAVWLATRRWPRSPVFWRILGRELHDAVRSSGRQLWRRHDTDFAGRETRAALVGITHGIAGRIGPPPPWILAGRGTDTQSRESDHPPGGAASVVASPSHRRVLLSGLGRIGARRSRR